MNVVGYIMLFAAVTADAAYAILSRKASEFSSFEKTYIMAAMGAAVFTAGALIEHGANGTIMEYIALPFTDMQFLTAVLYLALGCQTVAFILHNYGISVIGANRSSSFAGITTLTSVLSGVIILGESFSVLQGIATLLILIGAYEANRLPRGAVAIEPEPGKR